MQKSSMVKQPLLNRAGYALLHASQALVQLLEVDVAERRGLETQVRIL
jgi:hypothetical protein